MDYTIIAIDGANDWTHATDSKEIFKIMETPEADHVNYLTEISGYNPRQDRIYLPRSTKKNKLEIHLTDFAPGTYRYFPYDESDEWRLVSRVNLSISPTKHPLARDSPKIKAFIEGAKPHYDEALYNHLTTDYYKGVYVNYSTGGWSASGGMTEEEILERYSKSLENFGNNPDIAYLLDDDLYGALSIAQGHPSAIAGLRYQEENQAETRDFYEYASETLDISGLFKDYKPRMLVQIEAENTLSLSEIIDSIFFHDGTKVSERKAGAISVKGVIKRPRKYSMEVADVIINFNPAAHVLEINASSFDIFGPPTFAAGKNKKVVRKKLARQDYDFLYDEKKGGLYFNENGEGKDFGNGGIIAIIRGAPSLTSSNFEFS